MGGPERIQIHSAMANFQLSLYAIRPGISPGRKKNPERNFPYSNDFIFTQTQVRKPFTTIIMFLSGDEGARTPGLRLAKAALSQLSYIPKIFLG